MSEKIYNTEEVKQTAEQMFDKYFELWKDTSHSIKLERQATIETVIMVINSIITANPHSNPLNGEAISTMGFWLQVEKYLVNKQIEIYYEK